MRPWLPAHYELQLYAAFVRRERREADRFLTPQLLAAREELLLRLGLQNYNP